MDPFPLSPTEGALYFPCPDAVATAARYYMPETSASKTPPKLSSLRSRPLPFHHFRYFAPPISRYAPSPSFSKPAKPQPQTTSTPRYFDVLFLPQFYLILHATLGVCNTAIPCSDACIQVGVLSSLCACTCCSNVLQCLFCLCFRANIVHVMVTALYASLFDTRAALRPAIATYTNASKLCAVCDTRWKKWPRRMHKAVKNLRLF